MSSTPSSLFEGLVLVRQPVQGTWQLGFLAIVAVAIFSSCTTESLPRASQKERPESALPALAVTPKTMTQDTPPQDKQPQDRQPEDEQPKVSKTPSLDERLLFFPSRYPAGNWQPANLKYEDVWFAAQDGTKLHAWYCAADLPQGFILVAHGNAGHLADRAAWLRYLQQDLKLSVMMFDYRGYGRSEGVATVEGVLLDARAARAKFCELTGKTAQEIIMMGESLGGAVVIQMAAESNPRALIVQSTFSTLREVAHFHFPLLSRLVPETKLDNVAAIRKYQGPLLYSHGDQDDTIPLDLGRKLFEAANEPKTMLELPDVGHNDWMNERYLNDLKSFLRQVHGD